jgi:hypothetical protein
MSAYRIKRRRLMRLIAFLAIAALGLGACNQGPKGLLIGGAWTCAETDANMSLHFQGDGKLTSDVSLDDTSPDGLHVKLRTGGTWEFKGEDDLSFAFADVAIVEAKRGGQPLEPAEAEYFKGMFSNPDPVNAKISSISADKLVMSQDGKDDMTCTR